MRLLQKFCVHSMNPHSTHPSDCYNEAVMTNFPEDLRVVGGGDGKALDLLLYEGPQLCHQELRGTKHDFCKPFRAVWLLTAVLRIRDVYPGSWFLPIPDPGSRNPDPKTATKERGEKKLVAIPFYVATNFTKLQIISFFNVEEKNLANSKKL